MFDRVGSAVQRQDHQRQQQRDPELDANRNIGFASPGNSITMAPMRANTSMKAAASAGSSEISMRMIDA